MIRGRRLIVACVAISALALSGASLRITAQSAGLPARLSDQEFWRTIEEFSEPNGFFRSDNLVSNEDTFQYVIPELLRMVRPGGVYLGVGPDQNFTYITALQPRMAFITDIRRGNLQTHLMYKALIELSSDRADFLSRLFARRRAPGLEVTARPDELFRSLAAQPPDRARYDEQLRQILDHLRRRHGFPLDEEDASGITYVYSNFFASGPAIAYSNSGGGRSRYPSYADLQLTDDGQGVNRSYLSSEQAFSTLKTMEQNNLIVPIVGNFAGPHALRAVGAYLRASGATVSVFYTSNVEQYLFQDRLWDAFAANVGSLPLEESSTFIRSCFNSCSSPSGSRAVTLLDSMPGLLRDANAGRIRLYWDVLSHSRLKESR